MLDAEADREGVASVVLQDHLLGIAGIERARTIFEWGPQPKPGGPRPGKKQGRSTPNAEATGEPTDSDDQRVDHHMEEQA